MYSYTMVNIIPSVLANYVIKWDILLNGTGYHEICARFLFIRIHARHPGGHEYNHTN